MPNEGIPPSAPLPPEKQEANAEAAPSKEAVLLVLKSAFEGAEPPVSRERHDEQGLVLLEARREANPGETTEYIYIRKGAHEIIGDDGLKKRIASISNDIRVAYYEDGIPVGGSTYAVYSQETKTWKILEEAPAGKDVQETEEHDVSSESPEEVARLNAELTERVGLLRTQGIGTVEAAFPRVANVSGTSPEDLSETELEAYEVARRELALREGYEVDVQSEGKFLVLKKGNLTFLLKNFALPSEYGIGGHSRISVLELRRKTAEGEESIMHFDDGWVVENTDPEVQKEIDRVVAIFG